MKPPTEKQLDTLAFVACHIADKRYAPTVREVAAHFGIAVQAANDRIRALVRKGSLERVPGISRGLRVAA